MSHQIRLLIRADANTQIGTGHVMRCLALAQAWHDRGGIAHFASVELPLSIVEQLSSENIEYHRLHASSGSSEDAIQLGELANDLESDWLVVDGYHFDTEYLQAVRIYGLKMLLVGDDARVETNIPDILLNQNAYASNSTFRGEEIRGRYLYGSKYVLLRREFNRFRGRQLERAAPPRRILVTLGGGDHVNATLKVLKAIENTQLHDLEVDVVLGPAYQVSRDFDLSKGIVHFNYYSDVTNISELMARADMAISTAGTTCWELAFMGLPSLLLVIAHNQLENANFLDQLGAAKNLGWYADITSHRISDVIKEMVKNSSNLGRMSQVGRKLVDGYGSDRVVSALMGEPFFLRLVTQSDCRMIWEWANEPTARRNSFQQSQIPWENHIKWFKEKWDDPESVMFVAEIGQGLPIGVVRFTFKNTRATVSVNIDRRFRSQGYGSQIIRQSCLLVGKNNAVNTIDAFIKHDNPSSLAAFIKAGFSEVEKTLINDTLAIQMQMMV